MIIIIIALGVAEAHVVELQTEALGGVPGAARLSADGFSYFFVLTNSAFNDRLSAVFVSFRKHMYEKNNEHQQSDQLHLL